MAGRPRKQKEVTPKVEEVVVNETVETTEVAAPAETVPAEAAPVEAAAEEKPKRRTRKAPEEKKASTKKATEKKAAAEKASKPGRPAKKATEIATTVHVQYAGRTFEPEKIVAAAKEAWIAKGRRTTSIKTLELYINVTENKAYPVINGEPQDGFDC